MLVLRTKYFGHILFQRNHVKILFSLAIKYVPTYKLICILIIIVNKLDKSYVLGLRLTERILSINVN